MDDSAVISQGEDARWLLFIHQLPARPDYLRVKVRRRLENLGAVPLKNSVYLLPRTEAALEDFEWLRRLVVAEGGEATVWVSSLAEGLDDAEIEARFRARSNQEYGAILENARAALAAQPTEADAARLKRQLAQAAARDHFGADGAGAAADAVREVEAWLSAAPAAEPAGVAAEEPPRGAVWVTRTGVHVDRMASAWLIRRFVDERARFRFVTAKRYRPGAGEIRFDMFEGEFTHEREDCTFEVLAARFAPDDPALRAIADIVHDIDCKDEKFGRAEAAGVASIIAGIVTTYEDDAARIDAAAGLFDGLYGAFMSRGG